MMTIGIIGCGMIANSAHIPAYLKNKDVTIKYFCDIIETRATECVEKYKTGIAVIDYNEVISDPEVDAISICTPNNFHRIISIAALNAGKHVLCEKPASVTYADSILMQEAAHKTGKVLNIGVVNRFNTAVNKIKDLILSGELGEIYHVYGSFRAHRSIPGLGGNFTTKSVSGGGALIDWGVHYLDLMMYCLSDPNPISVSGAAYSVLGKNIKDYTFVSMWADQPKLDGTYDVDDFVSAFIRTQGPNITINGAWAQNIGVEDTYIDFLGDKAGIRLQYGKNFKLYGTKNGMLTETDFNFNQENAYEVEVNAFVDCIKTGEKLPSHIDNVVLTAKIMQGIYDSSDTKKEIVF